MSRSIQVLQSFAIALTFIAANVALAQEANNWQIETRIVPPPAGAGEMLRNSIAGSPTPDVSSRRAYPQNEAQWKAVIAQRKAVDTINLAELEKRAKVKIEPGTIADVPIYYVTPNAVSPRHSSHLFISIHGGAYVFRGGESSVEEAALIASFSGIPAIAIDYRMPPEHPFPAALDDVVAVYKALIEKHPASTLAIGGTSAGGGLSLATVHQLKNLGLPVPGAIYGGTPWADLSKTGDTLYTNEGLDRVLVTYDGLLGAAAILYANGEDLKNPLISPVYGDFAGFPPTYLVTGTRDLFLSDTARTHRKLRSAGVIADLNVYEALSHAEYALLASSPESIQAYTELAQFLTLHLK
ncbi:MAG: alpha/beta hydrolase [Halioglobus sp.]